jgi:hypothetical protein
MKTKWQLTRVNQGYQMTRPNYERNWIESRELNWIENIIYYFRIKNRNGDKQ